MKKLFILYYEYFNFKSLIILIFLFAFFLLHKDHHYLSFFINLNKNRPKISIFVTIYNREKYITKCIQSIQNQTLKDIEIIAVNDGSNDNTLSILTGLAEKDHRIKIVNNDKNHGLLYSRAMGILNSSGEYIMNLDSDDEISDDKCLEYLYNQTQIFKVDIIAYSIFYKMINSIIKCNFINQVQFQPELFRSLFFENNEINDYLICNKLIKKNIFLKAYENFKNWIYNGKWNYFEDDVWNILVNKHANSKICLDKLIYIYNYNNNSLMNKRIGNTEYKNLLYRHEMYKEIFSKKAEEKYLIAEYNYLFNRLKSELNNILLINDNIIKKHIINIFELFLKKHNCSIGKKKEINDFLKRINEI